MRESSFWFRHLFHFFFQPMKTARIQVVFTKIQLVFIPTVVRQLVTAGYLASCWWGLPTTCQRLKAAVTNWQTTVGMKTNMFYLFMHAKTVSQQTAVTTVWTTCQPTAAHCWAAVGQWVFLQVFVHFYWLLGCCNIMLTFSCKFTDNANCIICKLTSKNKQVAWGHSIKL